MRKLLFLLGLIAFVLLSIYCVYNYRLDIQDGVQKRVSQNLASVTSGNITASTSGRDVTLTGNVDTQEDKKSIGSQARAIEGVRAVVNNLTVTPAQATLEPTPEFANATDDNLGELGLDTSDTGSIIDTAELVDPTTDSTVAAPAAEKLIANDRCQKDIAQIMEGKVIKFKTGSTTIDTSSLNLIKMIAAAADDCSSAEAIVVHGHTDNVGNAKSNMDLSIKRAISVGQQLKKAGVKQRVDGVGHGDLTPIADNGTDSGRAQNRRIEFEVK